MRRALIVGINYYENAPQLNGCVNDAYSMQKLLSRNEDGSNNFDTTLLIADKFDRRVERKPLKNEIQKLFDTYLDIALFYFSGHGYIEKTGGYLVTSECKDFDDGLSMSDLIVLANKSPAKNRIIVLDCCHSGFAGSIASNDAFSYLANGVIILAASGATQASFERNGSGIFTSLLAEAMRGGAANLRGEVSPAKIYAFIDQALASGEQRPVFKSNVSEFISLRKTMPPMPTEVLTRMIDFFPDPECEYQLDPSYEYSNNPSVMHMFVAPYAEEENVKKFNLLQKFRSVGLVTPVNSDHMYFAALESKSCKLTPLGRHYWYLIKKGSL